MPARLQLLGNKQHSSQETGSHFLKTNLLQLGMPKPGHLVHLSTED